MEDVSEKIEEFRNRLICPCGCCKNQTSFEFASLLYMAQGIFGKPLPITSGFRCLKHNQEVGGSSDSPSLQGEHTDLAYQTPADLFLIIKSLVEVGLERFRLYPHHLHVDRNQKITVPGFWWANYPPPKPKEV